MTKNERNQLGYDKASHRKGVSHAMAASKPPPYSGGIVLKTSQDFAMALQTTDHFDPILRPATKLAAPAISDVSRVCDHLLTSSVARVSKKIL